APEFADRTYIEPLDADVLAAIVERERPDAVLPTLGGQTALNLAMALSDRGVLEANGVELIGASATAIRTAENRDRFKMAMTEIGLAVPASGFAYTLDDAVQVGEDVGFPVIVRPSFILGGGGTGIASNADELRDIAAAGLSASPITEILIERSIAGWKEYELEVMRDRVDNCVVVCSIEMNPRVSRSSALASKATGFPIAKIAARLAVGYTLDEIPNDITKVTPASFEPTIDYVVTKVPRWAFEKFPGVPDVLGTRMQSVGEAMALGRTFPESMQKALRSLEHGRLGLNCDPAEAIFDDLDDDELVRRAAVATPDRPFQLEAAVRRGIDVDRIHNATRVDRWFLDQIALITEARADLAEWGLTGMTRRSWKRAKQLGFSDAQLAWLW